MEVYVVDKYVYNKADAVKINGCHPNDMIWMIQLFLQSNNLFLKLNV